MIEPSRIVVRSKRISKETVSKAKRVLEFFPELNGFYLYSTFSHLGRYLGGWKIAINPKLEGKFFSYVLAHELTHLVQYNQNTLKRRAVNTNFSFLYEQKIPKGEIQCDIWCYARDENLISLSPYLAKRIGVCNRKKFEMSSKDICLLARKAVEIRKRKRTYIVWFTEKLKELLSSKRPTRLSV